MNGETFLYQDSLVGLSEDIPLSQKLERVRSALARRYPFISRIAAALYDENTDLLKTFLHSGDAQNPLTWYEAKLSESRSLSEIREQRLPRVVNDLGVFAGGTRQHTQAIAKQGYAASYTLPIFYKDDFLGFVFFNSDRKDIFKDDLLLYLDSVANLLSQAIVQQLLEVRTLMGAVKTVQDIAHTRDNETGDHLRRMACYARIIARELGPQLNLDDEFIEYIHLFAPLHDIGKIAIPDEILMKQGPLSDEEFEVMKTHTSEGRKIIECMLEHFNLQDFEYAEMLFQVVEDHHEKLNGKGYGRRMPGEEVPLAARIIAVADVFDALTSKRPYKEAWDNDRAIALLKKLSGEELDGQCVEALCNNMERVVEVQVQFGES
jgi:HD-GYP domain-containing protein (c-di-GMP phosphodiesterase class II)